MEIAVTAQTFPTSADLKGAVASVKEKRDKSLSWFKHLTVTPRRRCRIETKTHTGCDQRTRDEFGYSRPRKSFDVILSITLESGRPDAMITRPNVGETPAKVGRSFRKQTHK